MKPDPYAVDNPYETPEQLNAALMEQIARMQRDMDRLGIESRRMRTALRALVEARYDPHMGGPERVIWDRAEEALEQKAMADPADIPFELTPTGEIRTLRAYTPQPGDMVTVTLPDGTVGIARSNRTTLPELLGFEAGRAHAVAWLRAWAAKLEAAPACHEDVIQAAALSAAAGAIERGEHA